MKIYGGVEVWVHFFLTSTLDGMSVQLHAWLTLPRGKRYCYLLSRRLFGLQNRSRCWRQEKFLACAENGTMITQFSRLYFSPYIEYFMPAPVINSTEGNV